MKSSIRVRFAPSPTGLLHIGGLRTALYNYLFARHNNGVFVLRMEDTDRARFVAEAEQDIMDSLAWAGMQPDEGPVWQSERKQLYLDAAERLVAQGNAYLAFDTVEELEQMRERLRTPQDPTPAYDAATRMQMRNSLTLSEQETRLLVEGGTPYVVRLLVPPGETVVFEDLIRGSVAFESDKVDDQVLVKADGMPTYHLANVVDDHEMAISHVIRGEEWLSSTPKHLLMYRYLGWEPPLMAHLPLIMSPGGGKLSKRKAEKEGIAVNVKDYRLGGYEPEALVNFLAFLGWSPGDDRELLDMQQMITAFSLERVSKSGALFDEKKLHWYNEQIMRGHSDDRLAERLVQWAESRQLQSSAYADVAYLARVVGLLKERVSVLPEILEAGRFFFEPPVEYDQKAVKKGWKEPASTLVAEYIKQLSALRSEDFIASRLKELLEGVVQNEQVGMGKLMMPVRVAVTGSGSGPDLFESMTLLGRDEVISRLERGRELLAEA